VDNALVIDIRGVDADGTHSFRSDLRAKSIRVTVLKNNLARKAFAGTALESLDPALEGPSALTYGGESVVEVARAVVEWARKLDKLDLKGAVLDGQYFDGEAGVKALSKFPTRDEALAEVVQVVLSPGANLVATVAGPGDQLMGVVAAMIEKLEKGESITKVA
jgi:large subunit ribosomal protein L10